MATKAFLEQAYLAYFGRPIDPNGVAAYVNSTQTEVENAFWASAESQALYGTSFGLQQINMVYNMLFGRDAEPAGLAYWANQIVIGNLTPAGAAIGILNGAQNDDVIAVNNKLAASALFTAGLDTTAEILGYAGDEAAAVARDFLSSITMTPATQAEVDAAIVASVAAGTGSSGETFTFTMGQDVFNGTTYNDVFSGFVGENNSGDDISTVQVWDKVNGGDGVDTLSLLVNYDYTIDPTMTNVEVISARVVGSTTASLDFANISGVNTLEIRDTNSDWGEIYAWNVNDEITTYKFTNVARQTDSASISVDFSAATFTGAADEITVQLANAGNTKNNYWANLYLENTNSAAVVEVMNVESMGSDNLFYYYDSGTSVLNTVNVTGDAALQLDISSQDKLANVNAADFDAGLTFWARSDAPNMTVTTGAGKDMIDMSASTKANTVSTGAGDDKVLMGANLATGDLLDGGEGTDTLGMDSATAIAGSALTGTASTAFQALFSNFETLALADNLVGNIDLAKLDGMQNLSLNGHGLASVAGLTSGATITETANVSNWLTASIAGTGTADVLNVNLKSAGGIGEAIIATGVETLNVVSTDTDTTAHTNGFSYDMANVKSITVTGNAGVSFGSTGSATKVTSFDASGVSGTDANQVYVYWYSDNATATDTVNITGSSGNDWLYGNAAIDVMNGGAGNDGIYAYGANDTLDGGAGDDTLWGGAGKDTLTGGAGKDVFNYNGPATDSNGTTVDTITDFVSGTDKILTSTVVTYVGGANGYGAVLTSLTGVAYQGVLDTSTSSLYIDVNGDAILDTADMVINLTGVTTLAQADFM